MMAYTAYLDVPCSEEPDEKALSVYAEVQAGKAGVVEQRRNAQAKEHVTISGTEKVMLQHCVPVQSCHEASGEWAPGGLHLKVRAACVCSPRMLLILCPGDQDAVSLLHQRAPSYVPGCNHTCLGTACMWGASSWLRRTQSKRPPPGSHLVPSALLCRASPLLHSTGAQALLWCAVPKSAPGVETD